MRSFPGVVLISIVIGVVAAPPRANAQSYLDVKGCEQVEIDFDSYGRIHFSIHNWSTSETLRHWVLRPGAHTGPGDPCSVLLVSAPPGWSSASTGDGGVRLSSAGSASDLPPGATLDGFQVVLSHSTCCCAVSFSNIVDVPYASAKTCFVCDVGTPAKSSTWGALKQMYR